MSVINADFGNSDGVRCDRGGRESIENEDAVTAKRVITVKMGRNKTVDAGCGTAVGRIFWDDYILLFCRDEYIEIERRPELCRVPRVEAPVVWDELR